jgi:hypothetical protein
MSAAEGTNRVTRILAAGFTTGLHGAVIVLPYWLWMRTLLTLTCDYTEKWKMKLPYLTEQVFAFWRWGEDNPLPACLALGAFLVIDFALLVLLDRPGLLRLGREVWSGLVLAALVGLLLVTGMAAGLPFMKIFERIDAAKQRLDEAERRGR